MDHPIPMKKKPRVIIINSLSKANVNQGQIFLMLLHSYVFPYKRKEEERKEERKQLVLCKINRLKTSLLNYNTQNCEQMVKTKKGLIINAIPC